MKLDIKRHREKIRGEKPEFNLVPFIDILFTILIFLVVTSSFNTATIDGSTSGKPDVGTGDNEYYLFPVANLEKVIVNGQDMSYLIKDSSIAIHSRAIDEGEISIKPRDRSIIITTPSSLSAEEAVRSPDNRS
ncbi:biopolymer transport protein ExbD/TolR [Methanobrevibacter cuticularis]|uniref:Biopolymer transport protein ExbD/TolR n=1 Tax=Methanobrevibacter cuticularis TaxID=47311 RepID=A0A166DE97_9EURY|nr:biopolymer transporter ExbD [Methanobrevibacter cuticularis]KZX15503.1 biopolymer transport protein ExbD/TolR [Methanobrevibacter cuticularis]